MRTFGKAGQIFWKDLILELRSKQILSAMLIFALLVVVVFAFAFQPARETTRQVFPGMIWVAFAFAGVVGLNRSFVGERQQDCLMGLLLAPLEPVSIYFGKVLGSLFLMGVMELAALPLFFVFFDFPFPASRGLFILILFLGSLGFCLIGTFLAALAAHARASEILLPLILFPVLVPVLIGAVKASSLILAGGPVTGEIMVWLRLLAVYDGIFLVVPWLLFEYVLEV
ncbi:MAG: ABC transporter permease [Clostridia bacterium]|jgi:heme exporter protein B|nr:ABC transporter permease [Clostridia bacterium]